MNRGASASAKAKKAAKEREKRKSQPEPQPSTSSGITEKTISSPTKETSFTRQYAGLSGDSIALYAEQTSEERLSEDVCNRLAEDINYKLRQILHTAMVKMRLSGRTAIQLNDIEETFQALNVDKVYGIPEHPEFIPFGDEGLYYLNDKKVNIIDIAEEHKTYIQTIDIEIEKTWLPLVRNNEENQGEEQEVDEENEEENEEETREDCFRMICERVVGSNRGEQVKVLDFLEENCFIGSMMDWLYNFTYIMLNERADCDFLTMCAFSMINSLEGNSISDICVSERQIKMIAHVLLDKIFDLPENSPFLRYSCTTLARMCHRNELKSEILDSIDDREIHLKNTQPLAFLMLIGALGPDCVKDYFIPAIDPFFAQGCEDSDVKSELLCIYNVIIKERLETDTVYEKYLEEFQETMLMFSYPQRRLEKTTSFNAFMLSLIEQKCSVAMAVKLLNTRRKLPISQKKSRKMNVNSVFQRKEGERKFNFVGDLVRNVNVKERSGRIYEERRKSFGHKQSFVLIGRTTLLANVFKNVQHECKITKCSDHSLRMVL